LQILRSLSEANYPEILASWRDDRGIYQYCPTCDMHNWTSLDGLVLALPEGQQFMRKHARIRELPEQEIEVDGMASVIKRFESVTNQARYEVVSARDTLQILLVNGRHL
jgi:hypothetical protein